MAKRLVLRVVAGSPAVREQAWRWSDEKWGSESVTPTPNFYVK
jgi:hypothetical protein